MFNPYFCKTEGARRLSIALSIVATVAWVLFLLSGMTEVPTAGQALAVFAVPLLVVYLAALAAKLLVTWVFAGFKPKT